MNSTDVYCLAIIPARGGSKGVPGKNLQTVGGKSLVYRAARAAIESERCGRVVCSTDDDAISADAIRAGADVPFRRPAALASDTATSLEVVRHAVDRVEGERGRRVDLVCLVEPTTPLRSAADIRRAVDLLLAADPPADSAVTVCRVTDAHPAWLRKIVDGELAPYFPDLAEPRRRQDFDRFPTPYRRNGAVYVTRRDVVMDQGSLYGGRCLACEMPPERSVNIDTPLDLACARAVWRELLGGID
ncbi:MAG: cytidylyltransferase domain-containing protein [Planctomycetota bacterium]